MGQKNVTIREGDIHDLLQKFGDLVMLEEVDPLKKVCRNFFGNRYKELCEFFSTSIILDKDDNIAQYPDNRISALILFLNNIMVTYSRDVVLEVYDILQHKDTEYINPDEVCDPNKYGMFKFYGHTTVTSRIFKRMCNQVKAGELRLSQLNKKSVDDIFWSDNVSEHDVVCEDSLRKDCELCTPVPLEKVFNYHDENSYNYTYSCVCNQEVLRGDNYCPSCGMGFSWEELSLDIIELQDEINVV